ncbi:Ribosomal protein S3, mitochondrial [Linum grandiflorum]
MQYLLNTKKKINFDPVVVLNHFVAPGVADPSTMGEANAQGRSLDKRIRSLIAFFVESSTSEKKCLVEAKKRFTHFIRQANDLRFAGTTKTTISLFPFFGATLFFPRDGVRVYNNLFFEDAREKVLGKLRIKCWNLMGKYKVMELIEKFRNPGGIGELKKGIEMMIEIILRNIRILYGYSSYLNEIKKKRSLLSNRTNTNTLIELVKIQSVYQSASLIAQDISFQLRNNKRRSFRSIFSKIVKDIPLVISTVQGIRENKPNLGGSAGMKQWIRKRHNGCWLYNDCCSRTSELGTSDLDRFRDSGFVMISPTSGKKRNIGIRSDRAVIYKMGQSVKS